MKRGRPPKFKNPQDLEAKIKEYFDSCWVDKVIETENKETGETTTTNIRYQDRPYTVAGLASYLGFLSRQSMWDYEQKEKFSYLIKEARIKIEMNVEEQLISGKNAAGPIFWLKNHADYKDKQEVDVNHDFTGKLAAIAAKVFNANRRG
jgi:hypothetical protein